jgi:hypothetical protein
MQGVVPQMDGSIVHLSIHPRQQRCARPHTGVYALLAPRHRGAQTLIIDRTFPPEGVRSFRKNRDLA